MSGHTSRWQLVRTCGGRALVIRGPLLQVTEWLFEATPIFTLTLALLLGQAASLLSLLSVNPFHCPTKKWGSPPFTG